MQKTGLTQFGWVAVVAVGAVMVSSAAEENRNGPQVQPQAQGSAPSQHAAGNPALGRPISRGPTLGQGGRPSPGQRPGFAPGARGGGSRSVYASQIPTRTIVARAGGAPVRWNGLAGGGGVSRASYGSGRAVRFGAVGFTEQHLAGGRVNRTYVVAGQVSRNRVFAPHIWQYAGHPVTAVVFVPAQTFRPEYYHWAVTPWAKPVAYDWGWEGEGWYTRYAYAGLFVPYDSYARLDLWMTDYLIVESLRMSYEAQDAAVAAQGSEEPQPPPPDQPAGEAPPQADPAAANPPAVTADVKDELDAQIRAQLEEQAAPQQSSTPPALRSDHMLFQVVEPLNVSAGAPKRLCSLSAEDYIKRTGDLDPQDNTVAVVVEASRDNDCPVGLATRVSFNDLTDMENEQEARVAEAMNAASKSMGPHGLPSTPLAQPLLAGNEVVLPDQNAPDQLRKM